MDLNNLNPADCSILFEGVHRKSQGLTLEESKASREHNALEVAEGDVNNYATKSLSY